MEAPKCRLCGKKEWNHVCKAGEAAEEVIAQPERSPAVESEAGPDTGRGSRTNGELQETGQVARNRRYRQKNRAKYNAYMREYMRRLRSES